MKFSLPIACVIAALAAPISAFAQESEGRRLAELVFTGIDTTDRGHIDQGQFLAFGQDVFVSMDSDDSGQLSLKEFLSWDYGMRGVAEEAGREDAYETALRVVFAFWDRDGDGEISSAEQSHALKTDFRRADLNDNALLSKEEFLGGFTVIVALHAAINPTPVE